MGNVVLEVEHRRAIAKRGEATYPLECCGLLLGHRNGITKQVVDIVFSGEATQPESIKNPYHIPSQEMRAGEEIARSKGFEILGSFHSRVNRPARPSIRERQMVRPAFSYVMVGIRDGRAHELTAWKLSEDRSAFLQEDFRGS